MAILKLEGKEIKAPFKTALHELYNVGDLLHVTTKDGQQIRGLLVKMRFSVSILMIQTVHAPRVVHLDNVESINIVNSCPADIS